MATGRLNRQIITNTSSTTTRSNSVVGSLTSASKSQYIPSSTDDIKAAVLDVTIDGSSVVDKNRTAVINLEPLRLSIEQETERAKGVEDELSKKIERAVTGILDVTVNGESVVQDKVAIIDLSNYATLEITNNIEKNMLNLSTELKNTNEQVVELSTKVEEAIAEAKLKDCKVGTNTSDIEDIRENGAYIYREN